MLADPFMMIGVYIVSQSGITAFDPDNGIQLWEQPISGIQTPWSAGELIRIDDKQSCCVVNQMVPCWFQITYSAEQGDFGNRCNSLFWLLLLLTCSRISALDECMA